MLSCGCNKYEYTPHLHILLHGLFKDPFRYNPILIVFMCFGFFFSCIMLFFLPFGCWPYRWMFHNDSSCPQILIVSVAYISHLAHGIDASCSKVHVQFIFYFYDS